MTPSRMFDVLKEDFDYWFIVGTLGILVLVTIVSQRLASIKMLRQAWQCYCTLHVKDHKLLRHLITNISIFNNKQNTHLKNVLS